MAFLVHKETNRGRGDADVDRTPINSNLTLKDEDSFHQGGDMEIQTTTTNIRKKQQQPRTDFQQ